MKKLLMGIVGFLISFQLLFAEENRTVALQSGYNAVGFDSNVTLAELKDKIGLDNLMVIQGVGSGTTYKKSYADNGEGFLNDFTQTNKGKGYWIKVNSDVTFSYLPEVYTGTESVNLQEGWSFIAPLSVLTLEEVKHQLGSDNLLIIQGGDSGTTYKKSYVDNGEGFLNSFTAFEVGKGYWVKVVSSVTLNFIFDLENIAKDSSNQNAEVVKTIGGEEYIIRAYSDRLPNTETSSTSISFLGQINGEDLEVTINSSYPDSSKFQIRIFNATEKEVERSEIVNYATNMNFSNISIELPSRPFITNWKVEDNGNDNDFQITIGTVGSGYNYSIDWGDGNHDDNVQGDISHIYSSEGTYSVSISGDFPIFNPIGWPNTPKLRSVEQWGSIEWLSTKDMFLSCYKMVINATDIPDLSKVTDMRYMFHGISGFNHDIGDWNVSTVTNMSGLFSNTSFNQDLNEWDVSHVIDMSGMFSSASNFNRNIGDWNVSNVTTMNEMFYNTQYFNQDISRWDISNVIDISEMFKFSLRFNQNINSWDTSNVILLNEIFRTALSFNQPIDNWDVSHVSNMFAVFCNARSFNQNVNSWDTSNVTSMVSMFRGASSYNQPINNWDTSNVKNMGGMFASAASFNQPIDNWNVKKVIYMNGMFSEARSFNQPIGNWDILNVRDIHSMFSQATSFNQSIGGWDVSSVQNMNSMFYAADKFNQDIGDWDVSRVRDMSYMFRGSYNYSGDEDGVSAFNQDIGNWNVSRVTEMQYMFSGASVFDQNLANWNVSNVTNMRDMFNRGAKLSTDNYDALLNGWSGQTLQSNVTFTIEGSYYSSDASNSRQHIIDSYSWIINDAGSI